MKPKVLFVYDSKHEQASQFMNTLQSALNDFDIQAVGTGVSTLLQIRKYPVVQVFLPATSKNASMITKAASRTRVIQTMLTFPAKEEDLARSIFGNTVIVFSEQDRAAVKQAAPSVDVQFIPPCISLPPLTSLTPTSIVRERYDVRDRLLVLALNDVCDEQNFDTFLYMMREYNRRDGFRLLLASFNRDKETLLWRKRVQMTIDNEKLSSTILLNGPVDIHSLIDGCDFVVDVRKKRLPEFDFPLSALEAVLRGKPLLCFNIPPLNDILRSYHKLWVCNTSEDFVRESKDLQKAARNLEQIGTDVARLARERYSAEAVAQAHRKLYAAVGEITT